MNEEDVAIVGVFNHERFEKMTEIIFGQMMAEDGSLDQAQQHMNFAMNAAYLYARNFDQGKRRHITERCLAAEMARKRETEESEDEFTDIGSGNPE